MVTKIVHEIFFSSDPQCNVVNIGLGLTRTFGFPYFHVPHTYLGNRSIGLSFNQLVRSFVLSRSLQSWNVVCCSVASLFSSRRYVPTGGRWWVEWDGTTQRSRPMARVRNKSSKTYNCVRNVSNFEPEEGCISAISTLLLSFSPALKCNLSGGRGLPRSALALSIRLGYACISSTEKT